MAVGPICAQTIGVPVEVRQQWAEQRPVRVQRDELTAELFGPDET